MPAYQGTQYTRYFTVKDRQSDTPIDVSGWEFRVHIRDHHTDITPLVELTTANGGFVVVDGVNGRLALMLSPTVTANLPVARVVFDVIRTNAPDGPMWMFGGSFLVRQPITR